jgi:hypothetical protein
MATVEHVELECDFCGSTGETVETRTLMIDGETREGEACARCWTKVQTAVLPFLEAGRRVRPRRRRAA